MSKLGCDASAAIPLAGCGDEASGERVKFRFALEKGDGYRMTMEQTMSMRMPSAAEGMPESLEIKTRVVSTLRCTAVAEDGRLSMAFATEEASIDTGLEGMASGVPGAAPEGLGSIEMTGTFVLTPEGKIEDMQMQGGPPGFEDQMVEAFSRSLPGRLPIPRDGMRVGETIDIQEILPDGAMSKMFQAMPGVEVENETEGVMRLVGIEMIDGVRAGEFHMDATMRMSMKGMPGGGAMSNV